MSVMVQHFDSSWMDRPVAVGSASGVVSTLVLSFLKGLAQSPQFEVPSVTLPAIECSHLDIGIEDIPWWTFLAGVVCGVLLGPTLDLLCLARQRWRRFIAQAFLAEQLRTPRYTGQTRPLHKVVA